MTTVVNDPDLIIKEFDSIAVVRHSKGTVEITVDTPSTSLEFVHEMDDSSQDVLLSLFVFSSRNGNEIEDPEQLNGQTMHLGVSRETGNAIWQHLGILDLLHIDILAADYERHD